MGNSPINSVSHSPQNYAVGNEGKSLYRVGAFMFSIRGFL